MCILCQFFKIYLFNFGFYQHISHKDIPQSLSNGRLRNRAASPDSLGPDKMRLPAALNLH